MGLTIALAGFSHETNTFASAATELSDFVENGWFVGAEILEQVDTNTVIGGAVRAAANEPSVTLVPLLATSAIPGGRVSAEATRTITETILAGLRECKPDAVVLDLHGAMVTATSEDGDAEFLAKVRGCVGSNVPIVGVLDLHANLSPEMVGLADVLLPYDTYPHIDNAERGAEAFRLAASIANHEVSPTTSLVKLPMMPPGPKQFSNVEPTLSIMAKAHEFERQPAVLNVGVCFAFPYADCPFAGMAVTVTTNQNQPLADRIAAEMGTMIWESRELFRPEALDVESAVHAAMEASSGPVVLADLGDNPGGGSACDGTALLWALLDLGAADAAIALIVDQEALSAAYAAGVGGRIELELGAKTDELHGFPVPIKATVKSLSSGEFVYEGPMDAGRADTLGQTAVLVCDGRYGNTVEVIVCERRVQPLDAAIFRSQGIEPMNRKILVVKSAVHFRGSFGPIASRIIEVDTPGLTSIDFSLFPYVNLSRPIWPLDPL